MNCSTFSNCWTLKIPQTSRPWEPASFLKQVETPAYFLGSSSGWIHSPICMAERGCSEVAVKYIGGDPSSPPSTLYKFSAKSLSWQVASIISFFMKNGGCIGVYSFFTRVEIP